MFDKSRTYEKKLKELVKKILLICNAEQIPVILSFAVADDGNTTTYISEMLSAAAIGSSLTEDKIARHAAVINGFKVIPNSVEQSPEPNFQVIEQEE